MKEKKIKSERGREPVPTSGFYMSRHAHMHKTHIHTKHRYTKTYASIPHRYTKTQIPYLRHTAHICTNTYPYLQTHIYTNTHMHKTHKPHIHITDNGSTQKANATCYVCKLVESAFVVQCTARVE